MSFKLSLGKVAITQEPLFTNEAIAAFPIKNPNLLDRDYLYWALQVIDLEEGSDRAAKGKTLNKAKLKDLGIPLPPVEEQRRIATILDKANAIRRKREQALTLADDFLRSAFLEMFGDPVTNPKRWDVTPFGNIAKVKIGPFGSLLHKEDYASGGIPIVNPSHIIGGNIVPDSKARIDEKKAKELSSYILAKGDLVIGRRGDIGRCGVVEDDQSGFICGTGSLFAKLQNNASPYFYQMQIAKTRIRDILEDRAVGVTMKNLNVKIMEQLPVITPPVRDQQRYDEVRIGFLEAQSKQSETLERANDLFASITQRAFKGDL